MFTSLVKDTRLGWSGFSECNTTLSTINQHVQVLRNGNVRQHKVLKTNPACRQRAHSRMSCAWPRTHLSWWRWDAVIWCPRSWRAQVRLTPWRIGGWLRRWGRRTTQRCGGRSRRTALPVWHTWGWPQRSPHALSCPDSAREETAGYSQVFWPNAE